MWNSICYFKFPIFDYLLSWISFNMCNTTSVQFSHSVVSDSLWPHGLQHARPPCPSPTLRVYSNSCPLSWWCHPTISSSVVPFSSHLQSFPASGSFQVSQFFASGDQSIGVSASTSVLPMKDKIRILRILSQISSNVHGICKVFSLQWLILLQSTGFRACRLQ